MRSLYRRAAVRAFLEQAMLVVIVTIVGLGLVALVTDCRVEAIDARDGAGFVVRFGGGQP